MAARWGGLLVATGYALLAGWGALVFSLFAAVGLALRGVSGDCALVAMA